MAVFSFEVDVGAHAHQFGDVVEAAVVQVLFDGGAAIGAAHHGHEGRLQVGGEAGEGRGGNIGGAQRTCADAARIQSSP